MLTSSESWHHVPCCSHRQDSSSLPRLQVLLLVLTCTLHMAHLFQMHLHEFGYVLLFQFRLHRLPACTTHVGSHHPRSDNTGKRSASTAMAGTHNLAITDSRAGSVLNHVLTFFSWSTLVNPNLKGILVSIQLTVISCIINIVFPFYNGTQARRANNLLTSSLLPVGSSMRLFYRWPVIMFSTSLISLWPSPTTRTSLSCSTNTFEPDPIVLSFKADSTSKGTWSMILLIVRGFLRRPSLTGSPTVTFCSVR